MSAPWCQRSDADAPHFRWIGEREYCNGQGEQPAPVADEFTPTTEQVRRQVQDGVLSTGAIGGLARMAQTPPTDYWPKGTTMAECPACSIEWAWGASVEFIEAEVARHNRERHSPWLASVESAAERRGAVKALRALADSGLLTGADARYITGVAAEFESGKRDLP